jgi:serine/threonine protein kinase
MSQYASHLCQRVQVLRQGEHLISACGSPHYAAPEVILAKETGGGYRFECDMWAVGVIAYTLLWYVSWLSLPPSTPSLHSLTPFHHSTHSQRMRAWGKVWGSCDSAHAILL